MEYHPHLITFLDILGFKNIIEKWPAERVEKLLRHFRETTRPDKAEKDTNTIHFINFSDTNIRATPLDHPTVTAHPNGVLYHELMMVAHIQADLIYEGVLLRGSLALGRLHMTKDMVFGPALNEAHFMESTVSVYPRVTLHPEVIREYKANPVMRNDIHDYESDAEYVREVVRKDADGVYFIDYLAAMSSEFDEGGYATFLRRHQILIEAEAPKLKKIDSVWLKYNWLIEYHNATVASYGERVDGAETKRLMVSPSILPFRHDL